MHLYHLTIQPPTLITHLLSGSFTGTPKQQEIVLIRGDRFIETIRVNSGRLEQIKVVADNTIDSNLTVNVNEFSVKNGFSPAAVQPLFGTIRSIALLKVPGEANRDYLVVGSDSGATVILALKATSEGFWKWERVGGMTHGRSGSRRAIPGQMVAVDPRGRALITVALESKKFAHSIGRNENKLTLSSPLESHRPGHFCHALVALDSGLEHHPAFATLEFDFGELDTKQAEKPKVPLNDFQNEMKQLCYYELDQGLNHVVRKWSEPVPFESQTIIAVPGGSDGPGGVLLYTHGKMFHHRPGGLAPTCLSLPSSHVNCLLTAWTLVKTKSVFFFLIQFEGGDIFKLKFVDGSSVNEFVMKYFDTLPMAVGMTVLRSGHLFLAAQNGPSHLLYQITGLGDDEIDQPEFSSSHENNSNFILKHSELVNLIECDTLPHFGTVTTGHILNLGGEDSPQFYLAHKDTGASVSITRWGTAVQKLLALEFPEAKNVTNIWSTETGNLLLSLKDSSVLLRVDLDESSVEQVDPETDNFASSLRLDVQTLSAGHLDGPDNSISPFIQIHPDGLKLIHKSLREWTPGHGKRIRSAAFNGRQIVLALETLEMVRLSFDPVTGALNEESGAYEAFPVAIDFITVAPLLKGRKSSRWVAIGTSVDSAIRILDTESTDGPEVTAIQALTSVPTSLRLSREWSSTDSELILYVGISGGILIRFVVDEQSGALTAPSSRFIGGESLAISEAFADGSILALGTRPWWMSRDHMNRPLNSPLFSSTIQSACPFKSLPGTFAAIVDGSLRILTVQPGNSAGPFYRHSLDLPGTGVPRKMAMDSKTGLFAISQMDRVSLFDPFSGSIGTAIEYHNGEIALACCFVSFHDRPGLVYLAVSGARNFSLTPRTASDSFIDIFPIDCTNVKLGPRVHRTPLEIPATAIHAFNGRLLIGVASDLRMYECGRTRILRKSQCKMGSPVISIRTQGLRIFVGTARDSHTLVVYRPDSNGLVPIADDPLPRGVVSDCLLDYDTLSGCDRFGNFFIDRLPAAISESLEQDRFLAGSGVGSEAREFLLSAPEKFERLAEFHIGDVVTVLERIAWTGENGREAIWYVTVSGAIGCFLPFPTKSSAASAQAIEKALQATSLNSNPLNQSVAPQIDVLLRSHAAFRSNFSPVKSVIDGDLVERLLGLPEDQQHALAQSIDRPLLEIKRKIEELRRLIGI